MAETEKTCRLGWHHLAFEVPASWEVVGYKKDADDGELVLSDRRGETMHVVWKRIGHAPSVERGLIELVKANAEQPVDAACRRHPRGHESGGRIAVRPGANCHSLPLGATEAKVRRRIQRVHDWWACFPPGEDQPVFAGQFLAEAKVLLHVTFPPHPERERRVVEEILASYRPNGGEERLWAAFGIDVTLPRAMDLTDVSPLPAAQRMRFEDRHGRSVTAYRFGMMPEILGGDDVATFLARVKGRGAVLHREGTFRRADGSEGVELSYTTRGRGGGFASLLAPTWRGVVYAWRRDDLKRLYAIENHARESQLIPGLAERMVSL